MLRKNPSQVTILSPIVTYLFTFIAGTGHVAYSVLPVIAEVARETKIRPERPLGIAVIASQQAITASPISAATVALLGLLPGITLFDILMVTVPATLIGVLVGAFCSMKVGKELLNDPEYQRRVREGMISNESVKTADVANVTKAKWSVIIFLLATLLIVLFGSISEMRPTFVVDGKEVMMDMPYIIEILMLSAAALILLFMRIDGIKAVQGSVFPARYAGGDCYFRYCVDGRHLYQGKHRTAYRLYRERSAEHAVAVWSGIVRDVYPAVQSGCYRACHRTAGTGTGHFSLSAHRTFSLL